MIEEQYIHVSSFQINGLKAIDRLEINSLAPMNLIAGDNNVGKSTLLEALYLLLVKGDISQELQRLACERMGYDDKTWGRKENLRQMMIFSFFKDWNFALGKSILLQSQGKKLKMELGYLCSEKVEREDGRIQIVQSYISDERELKKENSEYRKTIRIQVQLPKERKEQTILLEGGGYNGVISHPESQNLHLIRTSFYSKEQNARLWNNISLTGLEKYVVKALQLIEPDVENLAFLKEEENIASNIYVPYITLKNRQGRYPLRIMGDGMNRILSLILGIVNCANGVCLIDEIENGIYYRRQPELWQMIALLVEQLHVQVFATTHSLDCIRGFSEVARGENARLIRLEKRQKGLTAISYSAKELQIAMDKDIEIR